MTEDACPHCGGDLRFLEKDTSSGREYREYRCMKCGKLVTLGGEVALWQVLHDANEKLEAKRRAAETSAGPGEPDGSAARKSKSKRWWKFWSR